MRKNSEEKPIDIISMEEYLKKRQVVRQPETVWEGWREKSASALKLADIFYVWELIISVIMVIPEKAGEQNKSVKNDRYKNGGCNRTFQKIWSERWIDQWKDKELAEKYGQSGLF